MSDLYQEILVQRKTPPVNRLIKGAMYAVAVIGLLIGFMGFWPLFILAVVMIAAIWFWAPKLEVEYEYLYVNGELDIDAIYSKQKRKRIAGYDMQELEMLAPSNSHALDSYLNKNGTKIRDFSSGEENVRTYTAVFNKEKGQEIVKVELNDVIINDIRRLAPRKVNLY